MPETMHAIRFHKYGPPTNLVPEEVERPTPGSGEVLVSVRATGVHPMDEKLRSGVLKDYVPLALPHTPGLDFAGVVEAVGPNVDAVRPGEEVYGRGSGTYADYAIAQADQIARKPNNLSFTQAAAVPVGAETAWGAIEEAGVQPDQSVLVQGGAGGVGEYVVQLAVHRGARVIATASTDSIDFVRSLGASEVIDYTTTRFDDIVHDVDAVIDTVGGDVLERSMRILRPGGIVVSTGGQPSQQDAAKLGIRIGPRVGSGNRELLEQITLLIEEGVIKPHVDRVLPLHAAAEAQATNEKRHARGRTVLEVSPN